MKCSCGKKSKLEIFVSSIIKKDDGNPIESYGTWRCSLTCLVASLSQWDIPPLRPRRIKRCGICKKPARLSLDIGESKNARYTSTMCGKFCSSACIKKYIEGYKLNG